MKKLSGCVLSALALLVLAGSAPAGAPETPSPTAAGPDGPPVAAAYYLRLEGRPPISGSSRGSGFDGWIEVQSFSWGVSNPVDMSARPGGVRGAGRASASELQLVKVLDVASPALALAAFQGTRFERAILAAAQPGGRGGALYCIILGDVAVTGVQQSGGGDVPSESVSLAYSAIMLTLTDRGATPAGWSVADNRATKEIGPPVTECGG